MDRSEERLSDLTSGLRRILATEYADWAVGALVPVGQGLECLVLRGHSPVLGPVAFRVPWQRRGSTDNDPSFDARRSLEQEAALARHLRRHGVPGPKVYRLHLGDDLDFLASAFVENDGSIAHPEQVGALVATIHAALIPDDVALVAAEHPSFAQTLAARLVRRVSALERLTGESLSLPDQEVIQASIDRAARTQCVLHLDVRTANLLTRSGDIVGIVDWGNALVGDPALELARIAEYDYLNATKAIGVDEPEDTPPMEQLWPSDARDGQSADLPIPPLYQDLNPAFLSGYRRLLPVPITPRAVELLYRLDTAVMLAIVFLSEHPDHRLAVRQVERTRQLHRALEREG